jgi:two-component system sensor histidine kinase PrrB
VDREARVRDRTGAPAAELQGWPDGLRLIVDNLLANAAVHGGRRVEVDVRRDDGALVLLVDDDGPGIAPVERERVLERFARGEGTRAPGSGLGLALVAQQAALHGGGVRIGDAPLGGARVEVRLPLAGRAAAR